MHCKTKNKITMVEIYMWGLDVVTYNHESKKWEVWNNTCSGELSSTVVKRKDIAKNIVNVTKRFRCYRETMEDAKTFIAEYRDAWKSFDRNRVMKILRSCK